MWRISIKELRLDGAITSSKVRLILKDGEQKGIVSLDEAMQTAQEDGLALVEIGPNADPPVCRIMDYGKHKFEQKKREKEQKRRQIIVQVKELTMGPSIEQHDFEVKLKKAISFLEDGNRIKLTIRFKGRQILHKDKGEAVLLKFQEALKEFGAPDKAMTFEGRKLTMVMVPKKK